MSYRFRCRSTDGMFVCSQLGVFGCPRIWELTDYGFCYGGQDGEYRAYTADCVGIPDAVAESPWCILRNQNRLSIRLDWENYGCESHYLDGRGTSPYGQEASAKTTFVLPAPARLEFTTSGMADSLYPPSSPYGTDCHIYDDAGIVQTGHGPGGGDGCIMAPIVTYDGSIWRTDGKACVDLSAGEHNIIIWADAWHEDGTWRGSSRLANDGSYFLFDMQLIPIPE